MQEATAQQQRGLSEDQTGATTVSRPTAWSRAPHLDGPARALLSREPSPFARPAPAATQRNALSPHCPPAPDADAIPAPARSAARRFAEDGARSDVKRRVLPFLVGRAWFDSTIVKL